MNNCVVLVNFILSGKILRTRYLVTNCMSKVSFLVAASCKARSCSIALPKGFFIFKARRSISSSCLVSNLKEINFP